MWVYFQFSPKQILIPKKPNICEKPMKNSEFRERNLIILIIEY